MINSTTLLIGSAVGIVIAMILIAATALFRKGGVRSDESLNADSPSISDSAVGDARSALWQLYNEIGGREPLTFDEYRNWADRLMELLEGCVQEEYSKEVAQLCRGIGPGTPREMAAMVHRIRYELYHVINALQRDRIKRDFKPQVA